jgi:hypothetical protein
MGIRRIGKERIGKEVEDYAGSPQSHETPNSQEGESTMQLRVEPTAFLDSDAVPAAQAVGQCVKDADNGSFFLELAWMRATRSTAAASLSPAAARSPRPVRRKNGIFATAAWSEAACFSDAECVVLALCEAVTGRSDRAGPAPNGVWGHAARHFDKRPLATPVAAIAAISSHSRLSADIGQVAGALDAWEVP